MSTTIENAAHAVEREYWIDRLTRKHECGEEPCIRVALTLPEDGRLVHVWMPDFEYEDDRLDLKASMASDTLLTLVFHHAMKRADYTGERGILILARRQPDDDFAAHIVHELYPWALEHLALAKGPFKL